MGPMEVQSRSSDIIKISTANYEFGANYIDPKLMLIGRITQEGRLTGRFKYDLLDNITLKANGQSLCGHNTPVQNLAFDSAETLVLHGADFGTVKLCNLEEAKGSA
ncbi:putative mitochondrial import receptor subunit TOM40-2 [Silene latifolia]|uniref:putative mitochondrial import receptor subunit TOM40-2 n=1 Tax=Silene latifolia TaxID=37657 RepID=UPI003D780A43